MRKFIYGIHKKSLIALLLSNIFAIVMAIIFGWNFVQILWVYWAQSVMIGIGTYFKILSAKNIMSSLQIQPNIIGNPYSNNHHKNQLSKNYGIIYGGIAFIAKFFVANFFLMHFGGFHLVYGIFLYKMDGIDFKDLHQPGLLLIPISGFIMAHIINARHMSKAEKANQIKTQNITQLFLLPYIRIIPMHIIIIVGATINPDIGLGTFIIFTTLKTLADIAMYVIENKYLQIKQTNKTH